MPWAQAGSYLVSVNLTDVSSAYATFISFPASGLAKYLHTLQLAMSFLGVTENLYDSPYYADIWRVLSLCLPTIHTISYLPQ